ncbi:MAG TPA: acyl-CoA thioester hydrolase/BAAT C-terminal domain-containing protein [Rubrobacteraceae bacterium]|nr:acyl-CoA thioester hydrolase/BAAT C-terminal domain-containing protein [Rubrobacteraceae bacterium]
MSEGPAGQPIEKEGLVGTLFCPSAPGPRPTVIVLGGSGGGLKEGGAAALASEGFTALALAYFGIDPLPPELVEIPLEYFSEAIAWLKDQPAVDPDRIAVMGNSKGAELALLLGAMYPEDIRAVVGYAPSAVVWQSPSFDFRSIRQPRSSWSLGGDPVPFVRFAPPRFKDVIGMIGLLVGRPMAFRPFYERSLDDGDAVSAASIAVERIEGPVLLISGTNDQVWPSTPLSEMVIERLEEHDHPFRHEHLRYEGAGHLMVPGLQTGMNMESLGRVKLGGSSEANEFASADSWPKVLDFLEDYLEK